MKQLSLKNKRGQVSNIAPAVLLLVFSAIVLVFGLIILQEIRDTDAVAKGTLKNDTAYVVANKTIVGMGSFADFWEIIVLAVVVTVVIGLLLVVFANRSER